MSAQETNHLLNWCTVPKFFTLQLADISRSHIKFELHCSSIAFADEDVDNIDGVASTTDCANYCAANKDCKTAVWRENTGRCALKTALDDMQERENHHSLVKVGFVNGTNYNGGPQCSQRELDEKCANIASAEREKAKSECLGQVNDAVRKAQQDRTERERVERECGDNVARLEQNLRDTKRECRENLDKERDERDRAVRAERERVERKARTDQARAVQEERDRLMKEFSEQLRTEREAWAIAANKCAAEREQALQGERDRLGKECNEKLRSEQLRSESKCSADLRDEQDRLSKDCSERLRLEQLRAENKCSSDLQSEQDRLSKDCSERVRLEQLRGENKCTADLGRITEEKDRLIKQCSDDLRSTKDEKDRLDTKCNQDLQEKDRLNKECTDSKAQEQARRKDDICYNPGFGTWPNTVPPFDVDGITYVVRPKSHVTLADPRTYDSTSPASCARDFCNNRSDCFGIEWNPDDVSNTSLPVQKPAANLLHRGKTNALPS